MKFSDYLEQKFIEWQMKEGKRKTIEDFAAYIGVSQPTISMWLANRRIPATENVKLLADIFGFEIYDILGLERPDPDLHYIETHWTKLPESARKKIREEAEAYVTKKKK